MFRARQGNGNARNRQDLLAGREERGATSDRGRDLFKPDDAGELADFVLLVLAQLEQQRHGRRFELLTPPRSRDRAAPRSRTDMVVRGVDLARDAAQRGLDARPVRFLRRRQLQPLLDAGDLDIAQQRIGFLRRGLCRRPSAWPAAEPRPAAARRPARPLAAASPIAWSQPAARSKAAARHEPAPRPPSRPRHRRRWRTHRPGAAIGRAQGSRWCGRH